MTLAEEVAADFGEILSDRGVDVAWGTNKSFRALVGTPAVEYGLGAGGWDATSVITVRARREDIGNPIPVRGQRLTINRRTYKVTGVADNGNWPIVTLTAELITT